jgi:hypothetical protein
MFSSNAWCDTCDDLGESGRDLSIVKRHARRGAARRDTQNSAADMLAELSPAIRLLWGLLGKAQRLQLNEKWCTDLSPRAPGTVGGPREAPDADSATPDAVAGAILQGDGRDDWQEMREYVLAAEHMGFTRAQNTRLAPRLLDIAVAHRDSSDPLDEPVVLSAIRTGASMLRPEQAHRLGPLLESGHAIETSLVAMKMLGRVFEAQPPSGVDQYPDLATEVGQIARDLLKAPMLASRRSSAFAQLAVYALAALGSSEIEPVAELVRNIGRAWFVQQTARELRQLLDYWNRQSPPVAAEPLLLLERSISAMVPG